MFDIEERFAFSDPRPELAVIGWCCFDDRAAVDDLFIVCEGQRTPALSGLLRPDISRQLNAPSLLHSGFLCRFPVSGRVTARLVGRREGRDHVIGSFPAGAPARRPEDGDGLYATWIRGARLKPRAPSDDGPLLSVVLPTYNTSLYHLHRCLESIRGQEYPHWELCVADDASSDRRVVECLKEAAAADARIRVGFADARGGISVASNRAIATATGDFILLLDHDDECDPSALLEVAQCLHAQPDTDLIYSDEDKIDQIGVRSSPAFKPEFDHDLLCGFDYMGHLVAMRTALVRQLGGFNSDTDGAQDWDLLLRIVAATDRRRIRHIPKPLYHWRAHDDSTARSLDAKPYAVRAWNVVLARHTASVPRVSVEEGVFRGSMRLRRAVPDGTRVAVFYRATDGVHQRRCLKRTRIPPGTIFIGLPSAGVEVGDSGETHAPSDVTIVVNAAIESVNHFFLEELTAQAIRDDCAIVGGTILQPDGRVLSAGLACRHDGTWINAYQGMGHEALGYMGLSKVVREVASIVPHAFAFRTSRLHVSGGARVRLDRLNDLCAAIVNAGHRDGLKVLHTPYAVMTLREREAFHPGEMGVAPPALMLNRNLEGFPALSSVLQAGIP
jgi:O-antigen biosynthesis protein